MLAYTRTLPDGRAAAAAVNAGDRWERLVLPWSARDYFEGRLYPFRKWAGGAVVPLAPMSCRLLVREGLDEEEA